jgi:hypothetical protein
VLRVHVLIPPWKCLSLFVCLFFNLTEFLTQGLKLARQVLYHLSHAPRPFLLGSFSDRLLSFCLGLLGTVILLPPPPE